MSKQQQDRSEEKPESGTPRKSNAFWELIVPSARLEKRRLDPTAGSYPGYPQHNHAEEPKGTLIHKEKRAQHAIPRANVTDLYPHFGVPSKDIKPVERRAKRRSEPSTRESSTDRGASIAEEFKRTHAQPMRRREKGRPAATARAQPAFPNISLAEQLKRTQPGESDKHADGSELSEGEDVAPSPALHKEDEDEEASEGFEDTQGSSSDEVYDEDDSWTASSPATQGLQPHGTPGRASASLRMNWGKSLEQPGAATTSKRKTAPSQPASARGTRPKKRVQYVFKGSEEDSDEGNCEEEAEEEAFTRSAPHDVHRAAKVKANTQRQNSPILPALPPLPRQQQRWTNNEEWTLFHLRNQGKSWAYIGERVLGRTEAGARGHWEDMRKKSLKPVETRAQGRYRRKRSSVVSVMAKIPNQSKRWTKEEEEILISLRAQGKSMSYICKHIPRKGYGGCKSHWLKIKGQYPQTVTASKDGEYEGNGNPPQYQNSQSSSTSQLVQELEKAESTSRSATDECEDAKPSTNGNPPIDADVNASSAEQSCQETMPSRVNLHRAIASQSPKFTTTSTDPHNQQGSKPLVVGEDPLPGTDGSAHPDEPNSQPVIAKRDPQDQERVVVVGESAASMCAHGTQMLGTHRRSYSWPQ